MAARPRILVTIGANPADEPARDYAERLREAGAEPAVVRPGDLLPAFDGLLLTGGADVHPREYREEVRGSVGMQEDRDALERAVLEDALARDLPVLAICRGHQLFNVVHGGSLEQHLEQREPHRSRRDPDHPEVIASGWHDIDVRPGTLLAAVLGAGRLRVNSRHHQAVTSDRRAPDLLVAATSDDGIIEALERPDRHWALSVQWHPERDELAPEQRALFAAFVQACRGEIGG